MAFSKVDTRPLFPKVRGALLELLGDLTDDDWKQPTVCEGWDVKDIALHLLGVEIGNIARRRDRVESGPAASEELAVWLNAQNEKWVRATRAISPRLLQELLQETGELFDDCLRDLDMDSVTAYVSWVGEEPVPVWLDVAREYTERWVHQQQIRDATERWGLTDVEFMEPTLETFVHALPRTYKDVDAEEGAVVALEVTDLPNGTWHIERRRTGWEVVRGEHADPTARVILSSDGAWRLFTRNSKVPVAQIEGDEVLGRQTLTAVAIIA